MVDLYLFDLDGTLIDITDFHVDAYEIAYKSVFDVEVSRNLLESKFGKTEIQAHKEICNELKIKYEKYQIQKIIDLWESNVIEKIRRSNNVRALKGVREFLEELKLREIPCCITTANSESIASLLINKSGLVKYFQFFNYGDDVNDRVEILKEAIKKFKREGHDIKRVIIIGDTISDIKAGKGVGAYTVGVATGHQDINILRSARADLVLGSLEEYEKIFEGLRVKS